MAPSPPARRPDPTPLESGLRYQPHIDGLRGLAIAAVVGFHAFPAVLPGGYAGVDVFFVISGYLISRILLRSLADSAGSYAGRLADFYCRRLRRIVPALATVLLATLALGYVFLVPSEYERLAAQAIAGAAFFQNFWLAQQVGYFEPAAAVTPLLHLWSLAVEEQFYLLWPVSLWLAVRLRLRPLPLVVFLAATSFGWSALRPPDAGASSFFLPQMRLWEILLGAGVAAIVWPPASQTSTRGSSWLAASALAMVAAGLWTAARSTQPPDGWLLLPTFGTAVLLATPAGAVTNRRVLARPALVWLGRISYPLYLWHWPLLAFAAIEAGGTISAGLRATTVVAAFAAAAASYYVIERPIRRRPPTRNLAVALLAALAAVTALAAAVRQAHGLPRRFPPLINAIAAFHYDGAAATRLGTYFLMGDRDETAFPVDPGEIVAGRPTLYLWGDSHAASLYPGLRAIYGDRLNLVQRTAAKTPPFLPDAFNPGNARQINQFVFNSIVRDRPNWVVLDASWSAYDWRRLGDTVAALKRIGIAQVIVVGPVPQWLPTLPQALVNFARRHPQEPVPTFLPASDADRWVQLDEELARLVRTTGGEYFSALRALAGPGGYRVRTGDTADSLVTYDQSHLTVRGSSYLVERLRPLGP